MQSAVFWAGSTWWMALQTYLFCSHLQIFDIASNGTKTMIYQYIKFNSSSYALLCPSALTSSLNGSLQLILDSSEIQFSRYYTGFKLRYWSAQGILINILCINSCMLIIHCRSPSVCFYVAVFFCFFFKLIQTVCSAVKQANEVNWVSACAFSSNQIFLSVACGIWRTYRLLINLQLVVGG